MLEPNPCFQPYQFVQKIAFKNKDIHRHDLGLDYFGFVQQSHVIERTTIEYQVCFAQETKDSILEYTLRPLTETEIQFRLNEIAKHPDKYAKFIEQLNLEPSLQMYHIDIPVQQPNCKLAMN